MTDTETGTVHKIRLPWSRPPLSLNDRLNRFTQARLTRQVRETVGWLVRQAKIPPAGYCEVTLVWVPSVKRDRDDNNPAPTVKAAVDGMVDSGVVPDDSIQYVRHNPSIIREPSKTHYGMWLVIETRDAP